MAETPASRAPEVRRSFWVTTPQDRAYQFFHDGKAWKARIGVPKKGEWILHKAAHFPVRAASDFSADDVCIILYDQTEDASA